MRLDKRLLGLARFRPHAAGVDRAAQLYCGYPGGTPGATDQRDCRTGISGWGEISDVSLGMIVLLGVIRLRAGLVWLADISASRAAVRNYQSFADTVL